MKEKNNSRLFWILQLLGWTVYTLSMFFLFSKPKPYDSTRLFLFFNSYLLGFLMTSFALRYLIRYLRQKIRSIHGLLTAVFFSILILVPLWYFIDIFSSMFFWEASGITNFYKKLSFISVLRKTYVMFIIFYGWTALYLGIKYWLEWQAEKKRSEEAFNMAQKAQLQMLRYQLNPHFLFNSLNSIKALVDENKLLAKEMITDLSDFLRYSLMDKEAAFRPFKEELDTLKLYLSIEKKRFEEKLKITYNIAEETKHKPILSFLIHPLIENAIKYGMKSSKLPLEVDIKSYMDKNFLIIEICNSGKWLEWGEAEGHHGTGTGLDNVKKRLENTYINNYRFDIIKNEHRVCVKIAMKTDE